MDKLLGAEDCWETEMGKSFPGERVVYRGKDLFTELRDMNWIELYLFGITGRLFSKAQARLFEGMWTLCTSYPDPWLWNNRVGSLAGSHRSTGALALSAAIAISEATLFGRRPDIRAIDFLIRTKSKLLQGAELQNVIEDELKSYRVIPGFGRPIANADERIAPLLTLAKELGLADGTFTSLAFAVEKALLSGRWRMRMNIAALGGALAADQGLSPKEYYLFLIPSFTAGIMPCFVEAAHKPEGTFLPPSCNRIKYAGIPPRKWATTA